MIMGVTDVDFIDSELVLKLADSYNYSFNSKIAAMLEKKHKWKEAMEQWACAMHQAKMHENQVWAYQRALYCRKQFLKTNMEINMSVVDLPDIFFTTEKIVN